MVVGQSGLRRLAALAASAERQSQSIEAHKVHFGAANSRGVGELARLFEARRAPQGLVDLV
ncbi:MAG: hypothetical protein ACO38A_06035, partial [Ilumatobacteraceae bacterium]